MTVVLYTDGACKHDFIDGPKWVPGTKPNVDPLGYGGWAWWVSDDWFDSGYVPRTTNNRMEMLAVIQGLLGVQAHYRHERVLVVSDSAYVVNCFEKEWFKSWQANGWKNSNGKEVKNRDYWERLFEVIAQHGNAVSFRHCRGHGRGGPEDAPYVAGNAKADRLAVKARQKGENGV